MKYRSTGFALVFIPFILGGLAIVNSEDDWQILGVLLVWVSGVIAGIYMTKPLPRQPELKASGWKS